VSIICVIGTGYVGLVTGTCLADMGNQVTCVDIIPEKIERLKQGILPIYEPGLEELVERNVHAGRLYFTTSYKEGLDNCDFIFIAVNTPTGTSQGGADMRYVESAARGIAEELDHYAVIINKSTVPVAAATSSHGLCAKICSGQRFLSALSPILSFCVRALPSRISKTRTALCSVPQTPRRRVK